MRYKKAGAGCIFSNAFLRQGLFLFTLSVINIFLSLSYSSESYANSKYASLVIDADTGIVLHQENAGKLRYPASLTKMMTLYLTFQAIERGKLSMDKRIRVSNRAAKQPPSKIGLRPGSKITVRDAILALVIKSANDIAVVLAEAVSGSEWRFAMEMTKMAKRLGMQNTTFRNASGLHDRKQRSTAYDMARLAVALRRDYPRYYHLFSRTKFFLNGKVYTTHNRVLQKYRGADGLKTGYVRASGFNLVTSAMRNGDRVIGVVMGGRTSRSRDKHMTKLLDKSFYKLAKNTKARQRIFAKNPPTPSLKPVKSFEVASNDPINSLLDRLAKEKQQQRSKEMKTALAIAEGIPVPSFKPIGTIAKFKPSGNGIKVLVGEGDISRNLQR